MSLDAAPLWQCGNKPQREWAVKFLARYRYTAWEAMA